MLDVALACLAGGVVGARLFYVLTEMDAFRGNLLEIIRIDHGGLVYYGGLIGGGAALFLTIAWKGLPVRRTLDVMAGALPLGHALGRLGCFMNGCCYGGVTGSWVGVSFPRVVDPQTGKVIGSTAYLAHLLNDPSLVRSLPVHPTQLYEAGANLLIFAFLSFMFLRRWRSGDLAWLYGVLYGTARFCNEFFRGDVPRPSLNMTVAQWLCIPLVAFGLVMFLRSRRLPYEPLPAPWAPAAAQGAGEGAAAPRAEADQPAGPKSPRRRKRC
jgi:phosphatidylglycerol:prolipoprotein diacylglycerol transferase